MSDIHQSFMLRFNVFIIILLVMDKLVVFLKIGTNSYPFFHFRCDANEASFIHQVITARITTRIHNSRNYDSKFITARITTRNLIRVSLIVVINGDPKNMDVRPNVIIQEL